MASYRVSPAAYHHRAAVAGRGGITPRPIPDCVGRLLAVEESPRASQQQMRRNACVLSISISVGALLGGSTAGKEVNKKKLLTPAVFALALTHQRCFLKRIANWSGSRRRSKYRRYSAQGNRISPAVRNRLRAAWWGASKLSTRLPDSALDGRTKRADKRTVPVLHAKWSFGGSQDHAFTGGMRGAYGGCHRTGTL